MQGEIPYQLVNSSETKLVVDAVSNPNLTKFVESAEKLQIKSITGAELAFEQS
jgi:shikimate 5-dehydrogenase